MTCTESSGKENLDDMKPAEHGDFQEKNGSGRGLLRTIHYAKKRKEGGKSAGGGMRPGGGGVAYKGRTTGGGGLGKPLHRKKNPSAVSPVKL